MLSPATSESTPSPLRILIVINVAWNPHFGAVRIYMELAEQWRAAGHVVEHFSLSDAFPGTDSSARRLALHRILFPGKAAAFVRKNAKRFDIIDALVGSMSASKKKLGFAGLLVARSVGWHRSYDHFERTASKRWQGDAGTFLGRFFYSVIRHWTLCACDSSVRHADLVNLPNEEEAGHLRDRTSTELPFVVEPYGLTADYRRALSQTARTPAERLQQKIISFVGMWGLRKGAGDWGQIVRRIRSRIPEARFRFLGTMVEANKVLSDLKLDSFDGIEVVSEYSPADLPRLLSDCAVGALPTYVEGFGLAILEQLAAGIPTVAFDAAGPREILRVSLAELLVPIGDIEAFSRALISILQLDLPEYERLVQASRRAAEEFSWPAIAEETLRSYRTALSQTSTGR